MCRPRRTRSGRPWRGSRAWPRTRCCAALDNLVRSGLRTNFYQRPERPVFCDQGRQPQGRGHALAAAHVRDLRPLAAPRGHPPARRQGGARGHPLERPPRRLPHRDPGPHEDPDGEELDHRARGLEGRLRAQGQRALRGRPSTPTSSTATASSSRASSTSPTTSWTARSCIRPRWCARTATIPTWWWRPTRARPTSPTPPTASPASTASGWTTPSPAGAARATTTRRWASPPAGPGSACATTSATWATTCRRSPSRWSGSATWRATCSATALLRSPATKLVAAFNHLHIFIDPDPDPEKSFAERQRLFDLPRSGWKDYDAVAHQQGRRDLRPLGQGHPPVGADEEAPRPRGRGGLRGRGHPPHADRQGRPALQRRHRHLREGLVRGGRRGGRPRERPRARRRQGRAGAGHRRGRQPRPHPEGPARVLGHGRLAQHRRRGQLGRASTPPTTR